MKSEFFLKNIQFKQDHLYLLGVPFGRLGAFIIIPIDTLLEVFKYPLQAIQDCVLVILNVLGTLCLKDKYSLKDALKSAEATCDHLLHIPVAIVMATLKAVYQFFAIMIDPENVKSFHHDKTFRSSEPFREEQLFSPPRFQDDRNNLLPMWSPFHPNQTFSQFLIPK